MQSSNEEHLPGLLEKKSPASVIFIGDAARSAADAFRKDQPEADIVLSDAASALETLKKQERFDLAVVINALETLEKAHAENLLAALRDLHARCVVAAVRLGEHWSGTQSTWRERDLLGLGMKRLDTDSPDANQGLFEFNIQDYKLSPDWLNARHWAHPELWDIYRW